MTDNKENNDLPIEELEQNEEIEDVTEEQTPGLDEENTKLLEALQRTQADFDNFRKQSATRQKQSQLENVRQIILEILPVLDNFRRASEHLPKDLEGNDWTKGVLAVEKQFEKALENLGLKKIQAVGEKYDPRLHETIATEKTDDPKKKDVIVEEVESGYMLGEDIIRASKVKVGV